MSPIMCGVQRLAAAIGSLMHRQACALHTVVIAVMLTLLVGAVAAQERDAAEVSRGVRSLPSSAHRGDVIAVSLLIEPHGWDRVAILESYPEGWELLDCDLRLSPADSTPDSLWVQIDQPADPTVLTYLLRVPADASGVADFRGSIQSGSEKIAEIRGASGVEIGTTVNVWGFDLNTWELIGIFGTLFFSSRFFVQWIASERKGKSVMPRAFWYLSIGGSAVLLLYGIHFRRLAVVLGQSFGFFVYIRNLILIYKNSAKKKRALQSAKEKA